MPSISWASPEVALRTTLNQWIVAAATRAELELLWVICRWCTSHGSLTPWQQLLKSSDFNHLRESVLQLKPLRTLPANLHGLINACPSSELLTLWVNVVVVQILTIICWTDVFSSGLSGNQGKLQRAPCLLWLHVNCTSLQNECS